MLACLALGMFAGCGAGDQGSSNGSTSSTPPVSSDTGSDEPLELVDYVAQLSLDMNNGAKHAEVSLKQHIDGDTSHFNVDIPELNDKLAGNLLKARYIAINTPESTGTIEPWGKKASNFTKSKLSTASSIIIETDGTEWETDSTGERYLVWVWYKASGSSTYRNLNLEILQEGLAVGNKAGQSRYGNICTDAIAQAKAQKIHVHAPKGVQDPDFFYGDAIELDLKELRTNIEAYNGKRVAFEATATKYHDWNVYLEDYDQETGLYYGISAFYGYTANLHDVLKPGNRVRVVGKVSYYEAGGTYQLSDLKYDPRHPESAPSCLSTGHNPAYAEITIPQLKTAITVQREELDIVTGEMVLVDKTFTFAQLAMATSVSLKNLKVVDMYTTDNGGSNTGAISLTCKDENGNTIIVRTTVLKDADGTLVTEERFQNKTIDVQGIIDYYNGEYQVKVFWIGDINIH